MILTLVHIAQTRLPEIAPGFLSSWLAVFLLFGGLVIMLLSGAVMTMNLLEKMRGKKQSPTSIEPNPLQVQEVEGLATKSELKAMEARLSSKITEVERDLEADRTLTRQEGGNLHRRIDELVETLAETKGILTGVKDNTERLLNRSLK